MLPQNLPAGAKLDPQAGLLTWMPNIFQAGQYDDVTLLVTDGHLVSSEVISITVQNVNAAPVLAIMPRMSVSEGSQLQFAAIATDIEGDALTFTASPLPYGASLIRRRGSFTGNPALIRPQK